MSIENQAFWQEKFYPPAVFIIADNCQRAVRLKQHLQCQGYQVYLSHTDCEIRFDAIRKKHLDIIVLSIEAPLPFAASGVPQKLATLPDLTSLPLILLLNGKPAATASLGLGPVYCLIQDNAQAEATLGRIIEQIHYLRSRYAAR